MMGSSVPTGTTCMFFIPIKGKGRGLCFFIPIVSRNVSKLGFRDLFFLILIDGNALYKRSELRTQQDYLLLNTLLDSLTLKPERVVPCFSFMCA